MPISTRDGTKIPSSTRWLSIGCGTADQELIAAREGLFESLDAIDVSRTALDKARRSAASSGITNISFIELDFNKIEPPAEPYDVIFMNMSLHHVKELDELLSRIHASLHPEGFLIIHEYIGPRQFQFTDRQLMIVRGLLQSLPEALRRDLTTGEVKQCYERRPVEYWNEVDPSEAIRSDLIVPMLAKYCDFVERIDYGGTILHLLLEHIIHNFDTSTEAHLTVLKLLCTFEDILIGVGALPSDFSLMALRKKKTPDAEMDERLIVPKLAGELDSENEFLQTELAKARSYIQTLESSRGWKLAQMIRRFLGRRW
ncbi:MAG: class I SAM-dependent methyltransferase [bacterium]|nr:class I SAM-dependent methyltransferase [bacterium]